MLCRCEQLRDSRSRNLESGRDPSQRLLRFLGRDGHTPVALHRCRGFRRWRLALRAYVLFPDLLSCGDEGRPHRPLGWVVVRSHWRTRFLPDSHCWFPRDLRWVHQIPVGLPRWHDTPLRRALTIGGIVIDGGIDDALRMRETLVDLPPHDFRGCSFGRLLLQLHQI